MASHRFSDTDEAASGGSSSSDHGRDCHNHRLLPSRGSFRITDRGATVGALLGCVLPITSAKSAMFAWRVREVPPLAPG